MNRRIFRAVVGCAIGLSADKLRARPKPHFFPLLAKLFQVGVVFLACCHLTVALAYGQAAVKFGQPSLISGPQPGVETSADWGDQADADASENKDRAADSLFKVSENAPAYQLSFTDGISLKTADGLFSLQFHNLTQVDARAFTPSDTLRDQFNLTREWLYFRGNVTQYTDYTVILAAGVVGSLNVLDVYFDLNPLNENKDPLQIRIGRFQTPFGYQWYKITARNLIANERSMFTENFAPNRQLGAMLHGVLLEQRLEYAAGIFNGQRNSFNVPFGGKEGTFFVNFIPFRLEEGAPLQYLNLAFSFDVANQQTGLAPNALRTANQGPAGPENDLISPTFLKFNPNVVEAGVRHAWAMDVAWFYRSFQFLGEYNGGVDKYGLTNVPNKTFPVSLSGYSMTAAYFFTGEEPTSRSQITPLRPYGQGGWGALEGFGRFSNLILGQNVFTAGLADPKQWANGVNAIDAGLTWYPNSYLRMTFDWQHAIYNRPVQPTAAGATLNQDLFWLRCQLYY